MSSASDEPHGRKPMTKSEHTGAMTCSLSRNTSALTVVLSRQVLLYLAILSLCPVGLPCQIGDDDGIMLMVINTFLISATS
jgi:hypothetical protein